MIGWKGLDFYEGLAADYPYVDYYLHGGAQRIKDAVAEVARAAPDGYETSGPGRHRQARWPAQPHSCNQVRSETTWGASEGSSIPIRTSDFGVVSTQLVAELHPEPRIVAPPRNSCPVTYG